MDKVIVLGCMGMLGHMVSLYLKHQGYEVVDVCRQGQLDEHTYNLDLNDFPKLEKFIKLSKAQKVINCVGLLVKDSEKNIKESVYINALFPHLLENALKDSDIKIIHISTDCVFNGSRGDYLWNDSKDGVGAYAQTKSLGEIINDKDLTIRTSIIGPEIKSNGTGLFDWFMKQEGSINGFSKCFWNGMTTLELAQFIDLSIQRGLSGLIQIGTQPKISKYDLLCLIKNIFNKKIEIVPSEKLIQDKSIINNIGIFTLPSYEFQLRELKQFIDAYGNKFNNYKYYI